MQRALVLSQDRQPLDPCTLQRAKKLLKRGQAAVFRRHPFTIILRHRMASESVTCVHRLKIDPGSKVTGMALVRESDGEVVFAAEIEHRGQQVKKALDSRRAVRRSRRNRKTRYRKPRFQNRRRREGWLPPSLESRVANVETWSERMRSLAPVQSLSLELVRFDTQKLRNPEIEGVEYQRGELFGYEVKEYLLEKYSRRCVYCGVENVVLEVEHIVPKSRGGSNSVSNLAIACVPCNTRKGKLTAAEFGHPEVQKQALQPLRDAAAMNSTRWALYRRLQASELPIECGSGARTKFNRKTLGLPKAHWIDAACVGESGARVKVAPQTQPLTVKACGYGNRQMCLVNKYGFPRTGPKSVKAVQGFRTGDLVRASVPAGKYQGVYKSKVVVRASGRFDVKTVDGRKVTVSARYCQLRQKTDGYEYRW